MHYLPSYCTLGKTYCIANVYSFMCSSNLYRYMLLTFLFTVVANAHFSLANSIYDIRNFGVGDLSRVGQVATCNQ